jgi:hypothetical protein
LSVCMFPLICWPETGSHMAEERFRNARRRCWQVRIAAVGRLVAFKVGKKVLAFGKH